MTTTNGTPIETSGMRTLLLDAEFGERVVRRQIEAKTVVRRRIPDLTAFLQTIRDLARGFHSGTPIPEVLVVDTLTRLSDWARHEVVVGKEAMHDTLELWTGKRRLNSTLPDWGMMSDHLGRGIFEIRALDDMIREAGGSGLTLVLLCHAGMREDEVEGRKREGPDLNNALLRYVRDLSDVIGRLSVAKTTSGRIEAGKTRILDLAVSPERFSKVRTDIERVMPVGIIDPTLPKLEAVLGERPSIVTIYGLEGVGKTYFGCSYSPVSTKETA